MAAELQRWPAYSNLTSPSPHLNPNLTLILTLILTRTLILTLTLTLPLTLTLTRWPAPPGEASREVVVQVPDSTHTTTN